MKGSSLQSLETIKKVAEEFTHRVWNKKEFSVIDELFHPEGVIHSLFGDSHGAESMKRVVHNWLRGFPDLQVKTRAVAVEKDMAMIHWEARGTHEGEFKGVHPTGKKVFYAGVTVYHIVEGKIVEYWAYLDMQQLLSQIH